jgi:hypothetical protein
VVDCIETIDVEETSITSKRELNLFSIYIGVYRDFVDSIGVFYQAALNYEAGLEVPDS